MTQITKALRIADALEKCDWAGCSIGNKEILRAAVAELRALSTLPIAGEPLPAELTGPLQWAMANAFEASEADTTAGKMIDVYDAVRAALSSPGKDGGQGDSLPADHIVLEQADLTDGRVSQTVRRPNGTEYERIVDGDEAYGSEE